MPFRPSVSPAMDDYDEEDPNRELNDDQANRCFAFGKVGIPQWVAEVLVSADFKTFEEISYYIRKDGEIFWDYLRQERPLTVEPDEVEMDLQKLQSYLEYCDSPFFRALLNRSVGIWIAKSIMDSQVKSWAEIRELYTLDDFWDFIVANHPQGMEEWRIKAIVHMAKTICWTLSESDDPGVPPVYDIPDCPTQLTVMQEMDENKRKAAKMGLCLAWKMKHSSNVWVRLNVKKDYSWNQAMSQAIKGDRNGITCKNHYRRLQKFADFCTERWMDPWGAATGDGPSQINIEAFFEHIFYQKVDENKDREYEDRKGASALATIRSSFHFAKETLELKLDHIVWHGINARVAECRDKFGRLPDQAEPASVHALYYLEHVVVGKTREATEPDRVAAGCMLFCVYACKRFADIRTTHSKMIPLLGEAAVTAWSDKMRRHRPKWATVNYDENLGCQWLEHFKALYPTDPTGRRDHLLPIPSKDYRKWHVGTAKVKQRSVKWHEFTRWMARIFGFDDARYMVPAEERARLTRNPRSHMFKHTMITGNADAGGTAEMGVTLSNHRGDGAKQQQRDYVAKAGRGQTLVKNQVMKHWRKQLGTEEASSSNEQPNQLYLQQEQMDAGEVLNRVDNPGYNNGLLMGPKRRKGPQRGPLIPSWMVPERAQARRNTCPVFRPPDFSLAPLGPAPEIPDERPPARAHSASSLFAIINAGGRNVPKFVQPSQLRADWN